MLFSRKRLDHRRHRPSLRQGAMNGTEGYATRCPATVRAQSSKVEKLRQVAGAPKVGSTRGARAQETWSSRPPTKRPQPTPKQRSKKEGALQNRLRRAPRLPQGSALDSVVNEPYCEHPGDPRGICRSRELSSSWPPMARMIPPAPAFPLPVFGHPASLPSCA